jgi:hypothetical protein
MSAVRRLRAEWAISEAALIWPGKRLVWYATRDLDAMCRDTRRWQTQYPDGYKKTNDRA